MTQRSEQATELVEQGKRAVTRLILRERERERERERAVVECREAELPRGDLSPLLFGNRRPTFETVPVEAGLNPRS